MKLGIKETFVDIGKLYVNFVHWSISKILFYLYGIGLGVIGILPLVLIFILTGGKFMNFIRVLRYPVYLLDFLGNTLLILSFVVFSLFYFFSFILLLRLNNSYLEGKKIPYFKNDYLNFKLFGKYLLLTLLMVLVTFIIPSILAMIIFLMVVLVVGGIETATILSLSPDINYFIAFTLVLFLLLCIVCFYLLYRFIFSYFILIDGEGSKNKKSIFVILKESFAKTKGIKKLGKSILIFVVLGLLYLPFAIISDITSEGYKEINDYAKYMSLDDTYKEELKSNTIIGYYFQRLEIEYAGKSAIEIARLQNFYNMLTIFFWVLEFLCINGVFLMALNSIYKRIIIKE